MSTLPEHEPLPEDAGAPADGASAGSHPVEAAQPMESWTLEPMNLANELPDAKSPIFQSWYEPEILAPSRIPHLGHLCLLILLALLGLLGASLLTRSALYFHLFGISSAQTALSDIHYTLGSEAALYLLTFGGCLVVFPLVWHKGFFAGVQWNGANALRTHNLLMSAAVLCFVLALLNGMLMPGPNNTPIDKIFRTPGAAWLLFAFGVTFAPFFEEMAFRGFLLPAICTACDWIHEKITGAAVRPLDRNGQPQWSMSAMVIASILVSLPFAAMHGAQTGYSWGPFVLLVGVSLVLCWARLSTRSLAASVFVHATYNFLLFSLMMLGTGGFRHLDRM